MKCRILSLLLCFAALIGSAAGQANKAALRPPSAPDLQGIWNFATITPLERPAELAGKEFFTEQEAAQHEKDVLERTNMDRRDGGARADLERAYNDFWWDRGTKVVKTLRTSLLIDPTNGRVPPLTAAATARQGTARRNAPRRPKATTSGVARIGPSAKPTLPPIENADMPLARRTPLA